MWNWMWKPYSVPEATIFRTDTLVSFGSWNRPSPLFLEILSIVVGCRDLAVYHHLFMFLRLPPVVKVDSVYQL